MSALQTVFEGGTVAALLTFIGLLIQARAKNRKLAAEAKKTGSEDVQIISATAMQLLGPVKQQLAETQQECEKLRGQVRELTAEVEHQRQVINQNTVKLEQANRRADYYQRAFEERANEEG